MNKYNLIDQREGEREKREKSERKERDGIPPVQRVPVYPSGQMHSKLPSRFLQVPPFRQGNCMHSLKSAKSKISFLKTFSNITVRFLPTCKSFVIST